MRCQRAAPRRTSRRMPATDGGETPIPSRGRTSCEPLRAATPHLGSSHPPALFCTLASRFRMLVPPFRKCVPTVPHIASYCSGGSSPLFRILRPTVPEVCPRCSEQSVSLFLRFVRTVPNRASHCSGGSSALFRTARRTVPHGALTVPHMRNTVPRSRRRGAGVALSASAAGT